MVAMLWLFVYLFIYLLLFIFNPARLLVVWINPWVSLCFCTAHEASRVPWQDNTLAHSAPILPVALCSEESSSFGTLALGVRLHTTERHWHWVYSLWHCIVTRKITKTSIPSFSVSHLGRLSGDKTSLFLRRNHTEAPSPVTSRGRVK